MFILFFLKEQIKYSYLFILFSNIGMNNQIVLNENNDLENKNSFEDNEEDDEDDQIGQMDEFNMKNYKNKKTLTRRGSIFSKSFDPETQIEIETNSLSLVKKSSQQKEELEDEDDLERIKNKNFENDSKYLVKSVEQKVYLKKTLSSIVFFKHLFDDELSTITDSMFERKCTKDEVIICEGNAGNYLYIIYSGSFDVFVKKCSLENQNNFNKFGIKVKEYKDRGFFGELALLYNQVILFLD